MTPQKTNAGNTLSWNDLPIELARRIESICTDFEAGAEFGATAIERRLTGYKGKIRETLLRELVWLDIELRQRRGESTLETDYSQFPSVEDQRVARRAFRDFAAADETEVESRQPPLGEHGEDQRSEGFHADTLATSRYRFEREVGRGGLGTIYRVFDSRTNRPLAIKSLSETYLGDRPAAQRLLREALLTGMLQHPGIPPVYDHGYLPSGLAFFSMKLVEGETLESILVSRASENEELSRCIAVFEQVAQTMAYAHSRSIIHRDLKPQNIMVGEFGEVQVIDWGLAKQLSAGPTGSVQDLAEDTVEFMENADTTSGICPAVSQSKRQLLDTHDLPDLTRAGDILGTPSSMSPEQARGQINAQDARTDVFGLGTILYQILTNRRLYEGHSTQEALNRSAR